MSAKRKVMPKPQGSRYTKALAERICAQIAEGAGLRTVARRLELPRRTIEGWMRRHPDFAARYGEACELRLRGMEDRLAELCEQAHKAALDAETGRLRIDAIKLEIDTLKWQLCKLLPRKYGDKSQMEITGKDGAALLPKHTREEDAAFAALVAAAQAKTMTIDD